VFEKDDYTGFIAHIDTTLAMSDIGEDLMCVWLLFSTRPKRRRGG